MDRPDLAVVAGCLALVLPLATVDPVPAQPVPTPTLGPREFIIEAEIGGRRLVLDYIAYLPSGSFAEINGVEARIGTQIEGFVVDSITATAVILRDAEGPIVLRAR